MQTKIIKINPIGEEDAWLDEAAALIRSGSLVAFPTETVYGLGADAMDPLAAKKIYAAKGRPSDNPLIVHIARLSELEAAATDIPARAFKLAEAFWPGPLTLILRKNRRVPRETTGGLDTVAVRMPSHLVAQKLITGSGRLIAAPSANASGRPSPTEASHVAQDLDGRIPLILDGGTVGIGVESTILDLTEGTPVLLRPGYITRKMLEDCLGEPVRTDPGSLSAASPTPPKAPGMKYRHYAPNAELILVDGEPGRVAEEINRLVHTAQQDGKKAGVIAAEETKALYRADYVACIGPRQDEDAIAGHLYKTLRELDAQAVDIIYSECYHTPRLGETIMNRLRKAAGYHIIYV